MSSNGAKVPPAYLSTLYDLQIPRRSPPERSLCAAIILRAFKDLKSTNRRIREDAKRFLFSGVSTYKEYREFIFQHAGINPKAIPKRKELHERATVYLAKASGDS